MKLAFLLFCTLGLLVAQGPEVEGNFDIRIEPTAVLQTGVQVPFQITVKDSLGKPVNRAKVTFQIETTEHTHVKVFPAPGIDGGNYIAKPVFPVEGDWNVYVEVRLDNRMSGRTKQFSVGS
ncbi:MAG: FixH family protein [Acidobacteriaceae bacterium]|nr:FixH family protein [Acidobacteriaceae bacterium]MBV9442952.1 FixH family protein [Acidobacteriaceae bacterium]